MEMNKLYFWTATIRNWIQIFDKKQNIDIVLSSLNYLSNKELLSIYGFVIMPNHIHFILKMNSLNGKEKPVGSFLKYTSHEILKNMKEANNELNIFEVNTNRKKYEIWQENPLAIELYSTDVIYQKLDYIHNNPVKEKWSLSPTPKEYLYSSANYYINGIKDFEFLNDIRTI